MVDGWKMGGKTHKTERINTIWEMNKIKQYIEIDKVTEILADLFYDDVRLEAINKDISDAYQKIIELPRIEIKESQKG